MVYTYLADEEVEERNYGLGVPTPIDETRGQGSKSKIPHGWWIRACVHRIYSLKGPGLVCLFCAMWCQDQDEKEARCRFMFHRSTTRPF